MTVWLAVSNPEFGVSARPVVSRHPSESAATDEVNRRFGDGPAFPGMWVHYVVNPNGGAQSGVSDAFMEGVWDIVEQQYSENPDRFDWDLIQP